MKPQPAPSRHILLVDDDLFARETVAMLLKFDGHRVSIAPSAPVALAEFVPGKYDLILTDHFMPFMTGARFADAIKALAPAQPIVMLTAFPEKLSMPEHRPASVDLLLGKPFQVADLRAAIAQFCGPVLQTPLAGSPRTGATITRAA